jgi:hypothetical protein
MKKWKVTILIFVIALLSFFICNVGFKDFDKTVDGVCHQAFGILIGVIVAVFGVLMGTITGMFTLFVEALNNSEKETVEKAPQIVEHIDKVVVDLKQNTLFLIFASAVCIVIPLLRGFNIPFIAWKYNAPFCKNTLLSTIMLTLIILSLIAIIDSINCIFGIYKAYSRIAMGRIKQILIEKKEDKPIKPKE